MPNLVERLRKTTASDYMCQGCADTERDEAADTIEALTDLLAQAIDLLNDAQSGYIPGSGPDTAWDARREGFLKDRAALTAGAED